MQNFLFFIFLCGCRNGKQQEFRPHYLVSEEIAPVALLTFERFTKKLKVMKYEKIQGKAIINSVTIPESVAQSNEENERLDVQISFTYSDVAGRDKEVSEMLEGLDADLLEIAEKAGRSNSFTYLLDCTRLGYVASGKKADDPDDVCSKLAKKMEGKELVFTTYRIQVSELLKGTKYGKGIKDDDEIAFNAVHTDARAYSSFNASYLLINDDADAVCDTVQTRILRGLENGKYTIGRTDEDEKALNLYLKSLRKKDDD
jgi:hypothetical protein